MAGFKFDPVRAERLLSSERGRDLPPEVVLDLLSPALGDVVADVGAGPGFFALPLARRVGPQGRVLALDIAPAMLSLLADRAAAAGLGNVETRVCGESSLPLPSGECQGILLAFLVHELADPPSFAREVRRVLAVGARGLALDWPCAPSPGPPQEHRWAPERAAAWLREAGLEPGEPTVVGRWSCWALPFLRPV